MAPPNPIVNLIVQGARARGLDPAAVLAVASQEGLSGRIGDGGHAYGPFQLNNAGGVITGTHPAVNDAATQAWASSPAGISFALDRIAGVARGMHGQQAVNAIVTRFERPANPGREIAGANAAYGNYTGSYSAPPAQAVLPAGPPQQPAQAALPRPTAASNTLDILNEGAKLFGLPPLPTPPSSAPTRLPMAAGPAATPSPAAASPTLVGQQIAKTALTQKGIPYQWGGQAKLGGRTDCSGLLQASAAANGVKIGRTTYQQWKQGTPVPLNQLQPGDGVFFHMGANGPEHVAIYIGNGRVVEDPHTGATVSVNTLAGRGAIGARRFA
jgi:cell wall-associated NlpC family hydrolase